MNPANKKPQNKKLEQFKEELKEIEARYQYQISAIIIYTPNGILPRLSVNDVIPPKPAKDESVATAPATDSPATPEETPAPAATPADPKNIEPSKK